jgi:hypothetical protein
MITYAEVIGEIAETEEVTMLSETAFVLISSKCLPMKRDIYIYI